MKDSILLHLRAVRHDLLAVAHHAPCSELDLAVHHVEQAMRHVEKAAGRMAEAEDKAAAVSVVPKCLCAR